ncbi:FAD binding domain-containing protein [Clostridium peptidivorans]|uniref:FAD binding domain-containing protein n=1 Tax=Clostridium peptidivorans TaxID=100174 RepID=UPI000BE32B08|nr:FAD binding domain-containing protein [Clostridium peptidivorans]
MRIKEYLKPVSLQGAYNLVKNEQAIVIGGGAFIRLGDREIEKALDLSNLNLSFIEDKGDEIEIGAMTTLREIECSKILKTEFDGMLSKAVSEIAGVQIRNMATIGGSVFGRYGFSDVITPLMALDTYVEFYNLGRVPLEDFLESKSKLQDILVKIIIKKDGRRGKFLSVRNTTTDFSILNVAISKKANEFKIAVGARPLGAKLSKEAMEFISKVELTEENAKKAGELAAENLSFGEDLRASEIYRRELCKVLVKRGIMGVI